MNLTVDVCPVHITLPGHDVRVEIVVNTTVITASLNPSVVNRFWVSVVWEIVVLTDSVGEKIDMVATSSEYADEGPNVTGRVSDPVGVDSGDVGNEKLAV